MEGSDSRREAVCDILKRFQFEHDLLVKRAAAFLTLNGLMAATVAAGETYPNALKLLVATAMIATNIAWLFRAVSVRRFIDLLRQAAFSDKYRDVLPADAELHRQHTTGYRLWWFTMTNVFAIGIPICLLSFWIGGIVIISLARAI